MSEPVGRLLTIKAASERFAVSDFTIRQRIRAGEIQAFANPFDRRACLLDADELARYGEPRPRPAPRRQAKEVPTDVTA